jgi:hypothetical protein
MQNLETYNQVVADLTAHVTSINSVSESAVALINGLRAQINSLITRSDGIVPVEQLQNLSSALDVGTRKLADAIAANTDPSKQPAPNPSDPGALPVDPGAPTT